MSSINEHNDSGNGNLSTSTGQNNKITNENWLDPGKTISKNIVRNGKGLKCPRDYSTCKFTLKQISGPSLEEIQLGFDLDIPTAITITECDSAIGRSLEKLLLTVKQSEICTIRLKIRSVELYEVLENNKTHKDELLDFTFELELISFEPELEIYQVDDLTKIERASKHKEKGVQLYRSNLVFSAFYRFSKALKLLIFSLNPPTVESKARRDQLTIACYLNIAQCQLATNRYEFVVRNCDKVLELDANNSKAYYRRAVAQMALKDIEKARFDLNKAEALQPGNSDVRKRLKMLDEMEKQSNCDFGEKLQRFFK